jgi:hypothetical protein
MGPRGAAAGAEGAAVGGDVSLAASEQAELGGGTEWAIGTSRA